ncbi:GAF domain-containing protein [Neisseriaceae bacterium TC5R-5]|nr:GAF domain-containing protein [Neisseriaceae bacterium TC5R-5]
MTATLNLSSNNKQERYQQLLPQLQALIEHESDQTANLANIAAALHHSFNWLWTGFYLVKQQQLVLNAFQGPIACTRIPYGRGVCGSAWQQNRTLVVPDVEAFPDHIACSSLARSEIVVPIHNSQGVVCAVLDVDSTQLKHFDTVDATNLEQIARWLSPLFS